MNTEKFWRHMGMNPDELKRGDAVLTVSSGTGFAVGDVIEISGMVQMGHCDRRMLGPFVVTGLSGTTLHLRKEAWWKRVLRFLKFGRFRYRES